MLDDVLANRRRFVVPAELAKHIGAIRMGFDETRIERSGLPVGVQRLVEADVPFKVIGDYVGHRSADSTQVYGKVAVHLLRQLALGDGEEVL